MIVAFFIQDDPSQNTLYQNSHYTEIPVTLTSGKILMVQVRAAEVHAAPANAIAIAEEMAGPLEGVLNTWEITS